MFIIDEAHLLAPDQLEELRLLTNAEMDSQSPFALLLVGQQMLARQLRLGVFAALDQRIVHGPGRAAGAGGSALPALGAARGTRLDDHLLVQLVL